MDYIAIKENGYELLERKIRSYDKSRTDIELPINQPRPEGYVFDPCGSNYFGMFKKKVFRNRAEIEMVEVWRKI